MEGLVLSPETVSLLSKRTKANWHGSAHWNMASLHAALNTTYYLVFLCSDVWNVLETESHHLFHHQEGKISTTLCILASSSSGIPLWNT